jgi:PTS system nitrogen regulatory IIA component
MNINQLIAPDRVECLSGISSKKRALESISSLLAQGAVEIDTTTIFHQLIERERLGSTGLGHGVALPHGRLSFPAAQQNTSIGCFIKLDQGIDFDSPDYQPADLLFGLLVPEQCTSEHLQILATLAGMFSDAEFCSRLRNCKTDEELYTQLSSWPQKHQAAS